MKTPTISIVTPSFNQAKYIGWTIRSVILQRYPALQYLVMDGGSSDDTVSVLKKYEPHLYHWQSAPDKGQSDAIRSGLKMATGDIMAYLNSDDMLGPGTLNWVAEFFQQHPEIDAVYSHRCAIDANNQVIWYWQLPPHNSYLMKRWDLIPQETCFWRRKIYEEVGGIDASFRFAMDYDLFVRFMQRGKFHRANLFLGAFRQHPEAKTSTQLGTIGQEEISRIWTQHSIRSRYWDPRLGEAFIRVVQLRSHLFAHTGKSLQGSKPGLAYSYDDLWAGQLTDPRIPPAHRPHFQSMTSRQPSP